MNATQAAIYNIIVQAYNTGLLQTDDMCICGITVRLDIHGKFNTLIVSNDKMTSSINVYDSDAPALQEFTIELLLRGLWNK